MKSLQFYITPLNLEFSRLNKDIRFYWEIVNDLLLALYLTFKENRACRKKDNFPANFNIIYKRVLVLMEHEEAVKLLKT